MGETKYPLMSSTMSVSLDAKAQTFPLTPVGRMVAPALTRPSIEFSVELSGRGAPHGNMVRNPSEPCGTTVTFNEKAWAFEGILQALPGTEKPRVNPPLTKGPPKEPLGLRVSAIRQGVTGTKSRPEATLIFTT